MPIPGLKSTDAETRRDRSVGKRSAAVPRVSRRERQPRCGVEQIDHTAPPKGSRRGPCQRDRRLRQVTGTKHPCDAAGSRVGLGHAHRQKDAVGDRQQGESPTGTDQLLAPHRPSQIFRHSRGLSTTAVSYTAGKPATWAQPGSPRRFRRTITTRSTMAVTATTARTTVNAIGSVLELVEDDAEHAERDCGTSHEQPKRERAGCRRRTADAGGRVVVVQPFPAIRVGSSLGAHESHLVAHPPWQAVGQEVDMAKTLQDASALGRRDSFLVVVATVRLDGSIQSSVVNAGVLDHPTTGEEVVGFVTYGPTKLRNLRARPRLAVTFRANWSWVTVEGRAQLIGPDDPRPALTPTGSGCCSARSTPRRAGSTTTGRPTTGPCSRSGVRRSSSSRTASTASESSHRLPSQISGPATGPSRSSTHPDSGRRTSTRPSPPASAPPVTRSCRSARG